LEFDAKWYKLDNAARIYPAIAKEKDSCVFRMAVNLTREVDAECLQQAVIDCKARFPSIYVKLRHGYHWTYYEPNEKTPIVRPEPSYTNKRIVLHKNNEYLFTIFYYKNRICMEMFHGLSDGFGAMEFLKAIIFRYFQLLGYPVRSEGLVLTVDQAPCDAETEDSFVKYCTAERKGRFRVRYGVQQRGKRLPAQFGVGTICGKFRTEQLLRAAKAKDATVTQYLAAVLAYCLWQSDGAARRSSKPINICIPVNMRSLFPSKSLRNFSLVFHTSTKCGAENLRFDDVLESIKASFRSQIVKEKFQRTMNTMVHAGKNMVIRTSPLPIKNLAFNIGRNIFGNRLRTSTASNLGNIAMPDSARAYIKDVEIYMPAGSNVPRSMGIVSFADTMSVSFSSVLRDTALEDCFFAYLAGQGIEIALQSNRNNHRAPIGSAALTETQIYPDVVPESNVRRKFVRAASILSPVLIAASAAVNIAAWNGQLWCAIFSAFVLYAWLIGLVTFKKGLHPGMKLLAHALSIPGLLIVVNLFAWGGETVAHISWAVSYAIPIVFICFIVAVNVIMIRVKQDLRDYLMYQLSLCVIGFVPLILILLGVAHPIHLSIAAAACSYLTIIGLIFFERKILLSVIQKKFYI
jgi:hypothetical protein